jgi:hypothetical protein
MSIIVKGSDVTINVSVKQSDGTTAYDLTGASIRFAVYQNKEEAIQLFEDGDVVRVDASAGTIKVYLDRANVDIAEDRMLYGEIELTVSDANFSGSNGVLKATDIQLGTIKNSVF